MTLLQDKQLQQDFIRHFLWSAYTNMEMEDEVHEPFNQEKLYERYKTTLDALIWEWIYKKVKIANER